MSSASALGLTVDDATALHNSNRLALRLLPCDVLARVALESRVELRVDECDGFVVTLWTSYEPVTPACLTGPQRECA